MKSYKDLEIYRLSRKVAVKLRMESAKLPSIDRFEVGSQIRRSSQSIKDNIVEGYGRRKYKADFIKHLNYAQASLL
jgi:four helix bundle protein